MLFHRKSSASIAVIASLAIVMQCTPAVGKGVREGDEARVARNKGTVALNLGRYDEAAERFEEAYTLTQDPLLLFSLGQAYRLANKPDKALAAFNSFLRSAGASPKARPQIERTATEIELLASTRFRPSAPPNAKAPSVPALEPESVEPPPQATAPAKEPAHPALAPIAMAAPPVEVTKSSSLNLSVTQTALPHAVENKRPIYKKWWFWSSVAGALALGGAATWYFTRPNVQQPGSTFGGTRVLP